jgi:hypothetical protein
LQQYPVYDPLKLKYPSNDNPVTSATILQHNDFKFSNSHHDLHLMTYLSYWDPS